MFCACGGFSFAGAGAGGVYSMTRRVGMAVDVHEPHLHPVLIFLVVMMSVACRVYKVDTMIVQAIGLLDELDKEINTYAMRVKEWFGWHFPEMAKVPHAAYCTILLFSIAFGFSVLLFA